MIKPNHRRMAVVSEALQLMKKGTSYQIAKKTGIEKVKVHQTLAALQLSHYVEKGERVGDRNSSEWVHIKAYTPPTKSNIDWDVHYSAFFNMVKA